jgi:hypothetical protein
MSDTTSKLSALGVCIQRARGLPASAPRHAATGPRRLVGPDVHGATPVEVGLGMREPGDMAKLHPHAAQEHAMDLLKERSVAVGSSVQKVVEPGTPVHQRLRRCPRAAAPAALLAILPYPVRRCVSSPGSALHVCAVTTVRWHGRMAQSAWESLRVYQGPGESLGGSQGRRCAW